MAQALELYFHLPLHLGYLLCSLLIIPLVFFGITLINQLQLWTQPIWIVLMVLPYLFVLHREPNALSNWVHFAGKSPSGAAFDPILFGMAATVSFSLIAQLGEQVDYLRFLPDEQPHNRRRWWTALLLAGPGWVVLGGAKQIGGAFLTSLAVSHGASFTKAVEPIQMYLAGFESVFSEPSTVLFISTLFVIVSQVKINVTNAYAGSLAWSNFFSRIAHNHPGRVVWLVFNITIALLLMEFGVFATLNQVLGLYSNVAIAWIGAVVADLVINKPLGISPDYIEFKRAYLYNFNPVGFGSMLVASSLAIFAFLGSFGPLAQAYAPFIALIVAFTLAPVIAVLTQGKYYLARENPLAKTKGTCADGEPPLRSLSDSLECIVCQGQYEAADMAICPVHHGTICSLCCSLDATCHDRCKIELDQAQIDWTTHPIHLLSNTWLASKLSPQLGRRLVSFLSLFLLNAVLVSGVLGWFYSQGVRSLQGISADAFDQLNLIFWQLAAVLLLGIAIVTWWFVLTQESVERAQADLDQRNTQLRQEIQERQQVESALRQSETQLRAQALQLEQTLEELKQTESQLIQSEKMSSLGQLVAGIAHEVNNPVNFIHGNLNFLQEYTRQLLELVQLYQIEYPAENAKIQAKLAEVDLAFLSEDIHKVMASIQLGTERIRSIVQSLRNFSRLDEAEMKAVDIHEGIESTLQILYHRLRATANHPEILILKEYGNLGLVECYCGQLNQVFMNIIGNAIDAIREANSELSYDEIEQNPGQIRIRTAYVDTWVEIAIADNGTGMSETVRQKLFNPFFTTKPVGKGTGMGLSISYQIITEKHGGQLKCISTPGVGTEFFIQIPLQQSLQHT